MGKADSSRSGISPRRRPPPWPFPKGAGGRRASTAAATWGPTLGRLIKTSASARAVRRA